MAGAARVANAETARRESGGLLAAAEADESLEQIGEGLGDLGVA